MGNAPQQQGADFKEVALVASPGLPEPLELLATLRPIPPSHIAERFQKQPPLEPNPFPRESLFSPSFQFPQVPLQEFASLQPLDSGRNLQFSDVLALMHSSEQQQQIQPQESTEEQYVDRSFYEPDPERLVSPALDLPLYSTHYTGSGGNPTGEGSLDWLTSSNKSLMSCDSILWEEQSLMPPWGEEEETAVDLEHLMSLDTLPQLGSAE